MQRKVSGLCLILCAALYYNPAVRRWGALRSTSSYRGTVLILAAAVLWGTMGIFVRSLGAYGFDSIQISALRLCAAALCFLLLLAVRRWSRSRIRIRDIPLLLGLGVGSVGLMTCCYFAAIRMLTMSEAAILLYTSPIWVMLMSALFFHERVTRRKLLALALSVAGCALVSGIGGGQMQPLGIVVGVGSGIAYGLYSILGSVALRRYPPEAVSAYTFFIAAIAVLLISRPAELVQKMAAADGLAGLILLILATGAVTAFAPFLLYTLGLQAVQASHAAILATVEPLVATVLGILVYHEQLRTATLLGIACILGAILALNARKC